LSRSRAPLPGLTLLTILLVPLLSCERGNWPAAPEGHNYRTVHIVRKIEGNVRGTSEEFIETSGYSNGRLHYKRFAIKNRVERDVGWGGRPPLRTDAWIINDRNVMYYISEPNRLTYKRHHNLDQYMKVARIYFWQELAVGIIQRHDLTPAQRNEIKVKFNALKEEDLKKVGAKITPDTFLGHKVKRYEIPTNGGRAILLMYGDIPLKEELTYKRGAGTFVKRMVATKFELNKCLPREAFTPPKGYKIIDRTRPIPMQ